MKSLVNPEFDRRSLTGGASCQVMRPLPKLIRSAIVPGMAFLAQLPGVLRPPSRGPDGVTVNVAGIPGLTYTVQRAPTLTGPWTNVATITIGDSGMGPVRIRTPRRTQRFIARRASNRATNRQARFFEKKDAKDARMQSDH
jgi:hypothetical protein